MSDCYSIQEVGGTKLAHHYPDRGLISDSNWFRAVLAARQKASGWRRLFAKSERFIAVLSANNEGLRIFVALDNFATFIPWAALAVSAERSLPGTVVRLQTAAVPSLDFELHLDDDAADSLFAGVIEPLPRRDPPGRLYWPKPWAAAAFICIMLVSSIFLVWLDLTPIKLLFAAAGLSILLLLLLKVFRPLVEEQR
jgi:hypothetical protein